MSVVECLNGEIGVDSVEGKGSTFWFILPADSVTVSAAKTGNALSDNQPEVNTSCRPLTVPVAEDDPNNYKLIEILLNKHYTLLHAWDGFDAYLTKPVSRKLLQEKIAELCRK